MSVSRTRFLTYLVLLVVFVNAVSVLPVIESPYLGDDSWLESTLRGTVLLTHSSLLEISWNTVKDFVASGRWYPLIIYYYPLFYYLDQQVYKALAVALVLANVLLFGYLVFLIASSRWVTLAAMLLPPLVLQLRYYHDPILSYYYMMQLEFLLILVSLILFIRYLRSSRPLFLVISVVCFTCSLLMYEAFYAFCIAYVVVSFLHYGKVSARRILRPSVPFFAVALANLGITLAVRHAFAPNYEGISVDFSLSAWVPTFFKQLFAAVPLSHFLMTDGFEQWFDHARTYFAADLIIMCTSWTIVWLLVSDQLLSGDRVEKQPGKIPLALLGLCFWVLPALLVPLSTKYQRELRWGLGYLPVYVSGFGVSMLAVAVILGLYDAARRLKGIGKAATVTAIVVPGIVICALNYNSNRMVIQGYNHAEHYHRALITDAIRGGLLAGVPEGSYLVCPLPIRSWNTPAFYRMHSGATLQVVTPCGFPPDEHLGNLRVSAAFGGYRVPGTSDRYCFTRDGENPGASFAGYVTSFKGLEGPIVTRIVAPANPTTRRDTFFLKYDSPVKGVGYAVLGHLAEMKADDNGVSSSAADRIRIYVGNPVGYPYGTIWITGNWIDKETLSPSGQFRFTERNMRVISSSSHGRLFELPPSLFQHAIDPESVIVAFTCEAPES